MRIDCTHCDGTVNTGETCECGEPAPDESELLTFAELHPPRPDDVGSGGWRKPLEAKGDRYA